MRTVQNRIQRFFNLPYKERWLFMEALIFQVWIGLMIKFIPFRWIPRLFSSRQYEAPTQEEAQSRPRSESGRQSEVITLISTATTKAARVSPWKNKCLVSSLAARCMLRRRKIHSRISLGVAKDGGGKVIAHAWLIAGEAEIVPKGGNFQQLYLF